MPDVVSAEAAALFEGLKQATRLGCNNILLRMDNVTVVEALNEDEGYSMVVAPILSACRSEFSSFGKASIEFCNRESNAVAHVLAEWGRVNQPSEWFDTPSNFIVKFLEDDVSVV